MGEVYLLNLYPQTLTFKVVDPTTGNSQSYTLSPNQYVDITSVISPQSSDVEIVIPSFNMTVAQGLLQSSVQTIYFNQYGIGDQPTSPEQLLQGSSSSSSSQSNSSTSTSTPSSSQSSSSSSTSQNNSSSPTSTPSSTSPSPSYGEVYLLNLYPSTLTFQILDPTTGNLLASYMLSPNQYVDITPIIPPGSSEIEIEIPSLYMSVGQILLQSPVQTIYFNEAGEGDQPISPEQVLQTISSQSNSSSSSSSSQNNSSPPSSSSNTQTSTSTSSNSSPSSSSSTSQNNNSSSTSTQTPTQTSSTPSSATTSTQTSVSTSSPTTSQPSSSTTSPTSLSPPTVSQAQVLAQIKAGDISSLQSEISEIPPDMIPLVSTVTELYQMYGASNGTPLSTVVERLLSDIRDAYYKISNHKEEEINTQHISQLLQIYNTLVSNGLAPQSQSASKLSKLVRTSAIIPALPAVLGQSYPGTVYNNGSYANFV